MCIRDRVDIAGDKEDTKFLLGQAEIPVPKGEIIKTEAGLKEAANYLKYPLVIKPIDGNHGRGVTTNIMNWDQAIDGFLMAKKISNAVIVEQYIPVSYTHLRAHETVLDLVCRLLLEKKKKKHYQTRLILQLNNHI